MALVKHFRELRVDQEASAAAREFYALSKDWPHEERYALTSQVRRSSRSVCANIAEAWRKRRCPADYASKSSDSDGEASGDYDPGPAEPHRPIPAHSESSPCAF